MSERAVIDRATRGLRREQAAHYIGVKPDLFDALVREGEMPQPITWPGHRMKVWDKAAIDALFDSRSGLDNRVDNDDLLLSRIENGQI